VAVYEHVDGPPSWRRVRPKRATTAGALLIVPSVIALLIWSFLVLLAFAAGIALGGAGSVDLHLGARFYLVAVPPVAFWIMAIAVGVLVLRGASWVRIPAVVMAMLAALAGLAGAALFIGLPDQLSVQYLVIGVPYVAVNLWLVYLLMSAEVGTWCQRP